MMQSVEIRKLLRVDQFVPLRIGLSDGRAVVIRHPDQVVVSERHVYVGLATLESSGRLVTPRDGDTMGKDWLWISILHVATVEPVNGDTQRAKRGPRGKRS